MKDLKVRTKEFALRIIRLSASLPRRLEADVIGKQVLRSGTSVGANYREGIRARSPAEYAAKLNQALMELEETVYWLELLEEAKIAKAEEVSLLRSEASELTAIFVTLIKKAKAGA
ncbi:MAG: four helix bundle protein [Planctomycetia bacterium]|nr:four helix bundle protein [Planctomycetia bacterium]